MGYRNGGDIKRRKVGIFCRKHMYAWIKKGYLKKGNTMGNQTQSEITTNPSFDHSYDSFVEERRLLERAATSTRKSFRLAKTHAYRMATAFVQMQATEPNRVMEMAKSEVGAGPNLIDRWIEHSFAELAALGEDFHELITAIHEGMTLKQYLADAPSTFLSSKKRRELKDSEGKTPLPPIPDDDLPVEKQAEAWRRRALAAEAWKPRALDAERRLARIEKQVKQMQKRLAKTLV